MVLTEIFDDFNNQVSDASLFEGFGDIEGLDKRKKVTTQKAKTMQGLNLPSLDFDIDVDMGGGSPEEKSNVRQEQMEQKGQQDNQGDPLALDLSLPELPDLTVRTPNVGVDLTGVAETVVDPVVESVQRAADTLGNVTQSITDPIGKKVEEAVETIGEVVDPILSPVAEFTEEAIGEIGNIVGDAAIPVADILGNVTEPVATTINETISRIGDMLGEPTQGEDGSPIDLGMTVRKGDGSGYGEVSLGNGIVVDASAAVNNALNTLTEGTYFAGVEGQDLYNIANDPQAFLDNTTTDAARTVLTDNLGMDEGLAGDVISAIQDPNKFVEEKGREATANFIAENTGLDAGAVGAGLEALSKGDLGEVARVAAETAAKQVATEITLNVVAAVPVVGTAIAAIARVFRYSCYLGTAAYVDGYIDKKDFLQFYRYRIDYQKNEFLGDETRIGYLILFGKIFDYQVTHPKFNKFMTKYFTMPWFKHISYLIGKRKFSLHGWTVTMIIRLASLFTYLISKKHDKESRRKHLSQLNILNVYKKTINLVEGRKAYA